MTQRPLQPWQTVARRELLDGRPWMRVWADDVRLPDGATIDGFFVVEMPDYVVIVALTPEGQAIVEQSYKHGIGRVSLSLPAGYLAPGELPLVAAQRELTEETGYVATSWRSLGTFTNDGNRGCGQGHFFLATNAQRIAEPQSGDHEEMHIALMGVEGLIQAVFAGEVAALSSAAAIGLAATILRGMQPS